MAKSEPGHRPLKFAPSARTSTTSRTHWRISPRNRKFFGASDETSNISRALARENPAARNLWVKLGRKMLKATLRATTRTAQRR